MNFLTARSFMQVACHCGQAFTIQAERFPHRVSCHACGHKFLALENGQAAPWDPGRSLHPRCRCGQQFDVWTEQFPYQIECRCGQRFSVLDTGETIGGEAPPVSATVASASVQSDLRVAPTSTAVCEKAVAEQFAALAPLSAPEALEAELKLLDAQIEVDRYQCCVVSLFGYHVPPYVSILALLVVLGGLFGMASGFIAVLIYSTAPELDCFLAMPILLTFGVPLGILRYVKEKYRDLSSYQEAEAAWKLKRLTTLAKYSQQMLEP